VLDVSRPFTRADALRAGISPKTLRGPRFRKIIRGVFVAAAVPVGRDERIAAALLVCGPGAFASHVSAARLLDLPIPVVAEEHVSVRRPEQRRRRSDDLVCHLDSDSLVRSVRGVPCAAPLDMFAQLAELLGLVDLVVVGDQLVRRGQTTPAQLVTFCAGVRSPGAALARRAASYVRDHVDSPMETRLRMLIVLAGLPEPEVNVEIRDDFGTLVMRFDLCYRAVRLAVEYDGRQHLELADQWERDVERRDQAVTDGWRLLTVTSKGIYREPERTVERVWEALWDRGWRPLPPRSDAWRPHFRMHRRT